MRVSIDKPSSYNLAHNFINHTPLTNAQVQEYNSQTLQDFTKKYGFVRFGIMNDLFATFQSNIDKNYVSRVLDSIITKAAERNVSSTLTVEEHIILKYAFSYYPLSDEVRPLLNGYSTQEPFSQGKSARVAIFKTNKSVILTQLREIKTKIDQT